jgi:hypothetical protein
MPFLYAILGIILFFVILFSIRVHVIVDYGEHTKVWIKYLFLKIPVLDSTKPKKEKPKKEKTKKEEPQEESPPEESKEDKPATKQQGNGLLKQLYIDQGYDGLVKMLRAVGKSLGGFFGKLYKTFVFNELYITLVTAGSDAATTAIKHGRLCAWVYPILGKLVSTSKVKKYDFDISPDFLAVKNKAELYVDMYFTPIHITNAAVVLALQLAFKVLFKILFAKSKSDKTKVVVNSASDDNKSTAVENTNNITNINKDGASK